MPEVNSPGLLLSVLAFIMVLGPLVFVHELGHYLAGMAFGVKADVFSIGFGKELIGWTDKRGTRWKIAALPLGGYVQFAGDENATGAPSADWLALPADERNRTFHAKPAWQRAVIAVAGPMTNLVLAVLILAGFTFAYGKAVIPPVIGTIKVGSVAEKAGLKLGDRIISMRGSAIESFIDVRVAITQHPGEPLAMEIERDGKRMDVPVTALSKETSDRFGNTQKIGFLGIGPASVTRVAVGPVGALVDGVVQTRSIMGIMITGISQIVTGQREVKELGGPIKIAKYSGEQLVSGWANYAWFVALISINLGFINLLPIPMLDGGHIMFCLVEMVQRRPVSQVSQEWALRTGLALMLALMLFVSINDVASLGLFGG
jgi:regulator of sigma E protease